MDKVKQMVSSGVRVGTAIREALSKCSPEPLTIAALARKHGLPRSSTNEAYNGQRPVTEAQVLALVSELGGTPEEWRELLKQARIAYATAA